MSINRNWLCCYTFIIRSKYSKIEKPNKSEINSAFSRLCFGKSVIWPRESCIAMNEEEEDELVGRHFGFTILQIRAGSLLFYYPPSNLINSLGKRN